MYYGVYLFCVTLFSCQPKRKNINAKKVNTEKRNDDNTHMTDWQGNKNRRDNKEEIHELAQMDY